MNALTKHRLEVAFEALAAIEGGGEVLMRRFLVALILVLLFFVAPVWVAIIAGPVWKRYDRSRR